MLVKNTALCVLHFDNVTIKPNEQAEISDSWKKTKIFPAMVEKGKVVVVKAKKKK